jgi:hypothetical protein
VVTTSAAPIGGTLFDVIADEAAGVRDAARAEQGQGTMSALRQAASRAAAERARIRSGWCSER